VRQAAITASRTTSADRRSRHNTGLIRDGIGSEAPAGSCALIIGNCERISEMISKRGSITRLLDAHKRCPRAHRHARYWSAEEKPSRTLPMSAHEDCGAVHSLNGQSYSAPRLNPGRYSFRSDSRHGPIFTSPAGTELMFCALHGVDHIAGRESMRLQLLGVDIHLHLALFSA